MSRTEQPYVLLAANPVPGAALGEEERLAAIRAAVDTRRGAVAPRVRRSFVRRRLVLLAGLSAAAVAVPLIVAVAGPQLLDGKPGNLISVAVAADGSLSCGPDFEGHAEPIRPDEAKVRLFPTELPSSWRLVNIFARSSTMPAACTTPSLMAADLDEHDIMRGGVWVSGPVDEITFEQDGVEMSPKPIRTDDTLNGQPAVRFQFRDSYSWLWTDNRRKQWHATVAGYSLDRAKKILAALGTDGDQVTWAADKAPGLRVLHRRIGPPYRAETPTESWYIRLNDGQRERIVNVESGRLKPLAADLTPGVRLGDLVGRTEIDWPQVLNFEPLPGSHASTEVHGDADAVRTVLAGLRQLPADDPRLVQYAMPE
ncbi:hypothetical protein AB0C02_29935 [Micromonospora sp. NPDC048999]|uniref:hypothetical protein n=1 Tax=Micromonospora sp. NPDC048999 TaxID=3155391 RepID=UPI0033DD5CB5